MEALELVEEWPVDNVAVAVFDEAGIHASTGDTGRSFRLASVSKPIAAFAALVAVEEGIVSLDDPVRKAPAGATLRHLLAHAGGLAPDFPLQVLAAPGERRIYSNAGFELATDHVAAAADMEFRDYARLALVEALGLEATDVAGSPAHGYRATVADLVTLVGAVVSGHLLAAESLSSMTTTVVPELGGVLPGYGRQEPNPWGLGVEIRGTKQPHWTGTSNSEGTWGHFGRSGTFLWWDPVPGVGLVALTDREFGPWAIEAWPQLADQVLATAT